MTTLSGPGFARSGNADKRRVNRGSGCFLHIWCNMAVKVERERDGAVAQPLCNDLD